VELAGGATKTLAATTVHIPEEVGFGSGWSRFGNLDRR
jgi:hypothetical protein